MSDEQRDKICHDLEQMGKLGDSKFIVRQTLVLLGLWFLNLIFFGVLIVLFYQLTKLLFFQA